MIMVDCQQYLNIDPKQQFSITFLHLRGYSNHGYTFVTL